MKFTRVNDNYYIQEFGEYRKIENAAPVTFDELTKDEFDIFGFVLPRGAYNISEGVTGLLIGVGDNLTDAQAQVRAHIAKEHPNKTLADILREGIGNAVQEGNLSPRYKKQKAKSDKQ